MISESQRSAEILQRFENGEPLNLSAVEVECPWLLEGLFDPENFKGWRESIDLAGVPVGAIRIEARTGVTCEECGFEGETLRSHLQHAHGMNAAEYLDAHPAAETSSEAYRAERMSNRHGRPAKAIIPHWEPAWSRNYALDRIHQFSKQGIPLHYRYLSINEPGFPAYVRRAFKSWDAGLAAAGIDVANVRRAKEAICFSADRVIASLREKEQEKLLGICFWRAAAEPAVGGVFAALRLPKPDRRAGKRGLLNIICWVVSCTLIPLIWPFHP